MEAPCTTAPFPHYPWFLDIRDSGAIKSTVKSESGDPESNSGSYSHDA